MIVSLGAAARAEDSGSMNKAIFLTLLLWSATDASAMCRVIGRDSREREILECDEVPERLPLCGSEFDRGGTCVVLRHQKPEHDRGQYRAPSAGRRLPENAPGETPRDAGGAWPNRAKEYGRGGE